MSNKFICPKCWSTECKCPPPRRDIWVVDIKDGRRAIGGDPQAFELNVVRYGSHGHSSWGWQGVDKITMLGINGRLNCTRKDWNFFKKAAQHLANILNLLDERQK